MVERLVERVETLSSTLWPILAGGMLAVLLGRWGDWRPRSPLRGLTEAIVGPVRRRALTAGEALERADSPESIALHGVDLACAYMLKE